MARDEDYIRLIHSGRWLKLRKKVLTAHPLCQRCGKRGVLSASCEVHHIRPVEEAVGYADKERRMYDPHNLLALCHPCHVEVHTLLGRCGKEARKKRNSEQKKQVIERFFGTDG